MNKSIIRWNHVYYVACGACAMLASLPPQVADVLPPAVKPYVVFVAAAAMWAKSHNNLFVDPNPPAAAPPAAVKDPIERVN